ncbi:hypothetical protein [Devosia sp.]|uniref:hypothetical protein n=1 Tax=Devosia sp. TaxID=1871048 RepID=UPI001AC755A5|nr:hypothetical protein [Devosia sp.]MBN9309303.1 hypothetical protein [Devosia sp.]
MRIAALVFGVAAGLFVLLAPGALRTDLISPFLGLLFAGPGERLIGTIVWYAIPAAAIAGGLLAAILPGLAFLPLGLAAMGWIGIGLVTPGPFDFKLLAPAIGAGLAAGLALVAAEVATRRRRMRRRQRNSRNDTASQTEQIAREAALRMDPAAIARSTVPVQPSRVIPLTLDDVAVKAERPSSPPPRWQDLDAPSQRQERPDIWGEAIRPEPSRVLEPEYLPEPEPVLRESEFEVEPEPAPPRGFRWDRADAPAGHGFEALAGSGPRLVPRPASNLEAKAEPAARRQPEPRVPVPPASQKPEGTRPAPDSWPRAQLEPRWLPPDAPPGRGLVAALSAVVAVLVLGMLVTGGYLAYREGWVDRLIGSVPPGASGTASTVAQVPDTLRQLPRPKLEGPAISEPAAPLPSRPAAQVAVPTSGSGTSLADTSAAAQLSATAPYTDPFAYCRAVRTVDYVDDRYRGPMVLPPMTRALALPENAARDRVHWRCVNGVVLACASYVGPVCDMAPSAEEMQAYCARYRAAPQLMAPGGAWSCVDGRPQLPGNTEWSVDARGFRAESWVVVPPPAAPAG